MKLKNCTKRKDYGADLMNLIPLIPLNMFKDLRPPTCEEISLAREKQANICRNLSYASNAGADAVGIPGKESDHHREKI